MRHNWMTSPFSFMSACISLMVLLVVASLCLLLMFLSFLDSTAHSPTEAFKITVFNPLYIIACGWLTLRRCSGPV